MVVYLDVLFGTNLLMDYLTLLAAARLGGVWVRRLQLLLAAALGGGYAALAAVWPPLAARPLQLLAGIGMCVLAFWGQRALIRVCALYLVVAAAFAGLAAALGHAAGRTLLYGAGYYFAVPLRVLLLAGAVGYAVSGVLLRGDARHGPIGREVEQMTVRFGTAERTLRVLHDTGSELAEPATGRAVLVLEQEAAQALLAGRGIAPEQKQDAAAQLAALPPEQARWCGLVPYCAVGTTGGLLLYFRPDSVRRADGTALDCVCAVGPENLGQGAYEGLIGV